MNEFLEKQDEKEGDLVKHIDAPEVAYELRLVSSSRNWSDWVPALYPAQGEGQTQEMKTIDREAVERGEDFLGELRLGEWSKLEAEQTDEDEVSGMDAPAP